MLQLQLSTGEKSTQQRNLNSWEETAAALFCHCAGCFAEASLSEQWVQTPNPQLDRGETRPAAQRKILADPCRQPALLVLLVTPVGEGELNPLCRTDGNPTLPSFQPSSFA